MKKIWLLLVSCSKWHELDEIPTSSVISLIMKRQLITTMSSILFHHLQDISTSNSLFQNLKKNKEGRKRQIQKLLYCHIIYLDTHCTKTAIKTVVALGCSSGSSTLALECLKGVSGISSSLPTMFMTPASSASTLIKADVTDCRLRILILVQIHGLLFKITKTEITLVIFYDDENW